MVNYFIVNDIGLVSISYFTITYHLVNYFIVNDIELFFSTLSLFCNLKIIRR